MKNKVCHTTILGHDLVCLNCGGKYRLEFPIPVVQFSKKIKLFNLLHADCKPSARSPYRKPQAFSIDH